MGTPALAFRSAWAVLAAADIYGGIARKVVLHESHAWDHRVTTSAGEKFAAIGRAGLQAAKRTQLYTRAPRNPDLWTRPRPA